MLRLSLHIKALIFCGAMFLMLPRASSQILSLNELVKFPHLTADQLNDSLAKKGWKKNTLEFVADSHYVRRTWTIDNSYNDLKSYILLYDYTNDTLENHVIYQFSDKKYFTELRPNLKQYGFTELNQKGKKKKKRKNQGKNIYEEKEAVYYSEKLGSVIQIKEVFVYGMFSFVIYSYKAKSGIGKNTMLETGNPLPK